MAFVTGTDTPAVEPTVEAVRMASRSLSRLLDADPDARDVLERLDVRVSPSTDHPSTGSCVGSVTSSSASPLGISSASIPSRWWPARSPTWRRTCSTRRWSWRAAAGLAVVGMGKLGGCELNYASDVDVMLVSGPDVDPAAAAREGKAVVDIARRCFRVDLNLRPEGRNGALVRTLASYEAYWDRWAEPWEFQALLRARAVAGDRALGAAFDESASKHLWARPFTAESLRAVRAMKVRSGERSGASRAERA